MFEAPLPPAVPRLTVEIAGADAIEGGAAIEGVVHVEVAARDVAVRLVLAESGSGTLLATVLHVAAEQAPAAPDRDGRVPFRLRLPAGATPTRVGPHASVRWWVEASAGRATGEAEVPVAGPGDPFPGLAALEAAAARRAEDQRRTRVGNVAWPAVGAAALGAVAILAVASGDAAAAWLAGAASVFLAGVSIVQARRGRGHPAPEDPGLEVEPRRAGPGGTVQVSAPAGDAFEVGLSCVEHLSAVDAGTNEVRRIHDEAVMWAEWRAAGLRVPFTVPSDPPPSYLGDAVSYHWYAGVRRTGDPATEHRLPVWVGPPPGP